MFPEAAVSTSPGDNDLHPMLVIERRAWESGFTRVAGIDEAGRGPLAGPVVAAAVIMPRGVVVEGVNDSKKLPEPVRERLYGEIIASAEAYGIGVVDPATIDAINILQATMRAMRKAIEAMSVTPDYLLIDGNYFSHREFPHRKVVKGDSLSHSIAAASILAKVTRDRMMVELAGQYPEYGFERHKGYGTASHLEAIRKHGRCPIHRNSFHVKRLGEKDPE